MRNEFEAILLEILADIDGFSIVSRSQSSLYKVFLELFTSLSELLFVDKYMIITTHSELLLFLIFPFVNHTVIKMTLTVTRFIIWYFNRKYVLKLMDVLEMFSDQGRKYWATIIHVIIV